MKGIQLPVNILIIVVIAVIILVAVIGFFYSSWRPSTGTISVESSKNSACQVLNGRECSMSVYDIAVSPPIEDISTLDQLCIRKYGIKDDSDFEKNCKAICMCSGNSSPSPSGAPPSCAAGIHPCSNPATDCPPSSGCNSCAVSVSYPDGECK
jgi:hypothetical protein